MKTSRHYSLGLAALLSLSFAAAPILSAQSAMQEPQYNNEVNALGPNGSLVPLESQKLAIESQVHNHFISVSSSSDLAAPGAKSTVRLAPGTHFIVKMSASAANTNPSTLISLKPFVVDKGKRIIPYHNGKAGMFQGAKSGAAADTSIPITFKPYGQGSLEIIPSQPLAPGEYEFSALGPNSAFCFGIDAN